MAFGLEDLVEVRGELAIPVENEEPDGMDPVVQGHAQISRVGSPMLRWGDW